MLNNQKKVLVIAPHQDDETIGCGGTICYLLERGYDVKVVHVFSGTSGVEGASPNQSCAIRHKEAEHAAMIGGYEVLPNLGFIDRNRSGDAKIQSAIIALLREVNPAIVFIPHKNETDYEHHLVSVEAKEALWLAATSIFPEMGRPIPQVPQTFHYEVWQNISSPSVMCNILPYQEKKQAMLAAFKTQMQTSGWINGSLGRNAYRGVTCNGDGLYEVFEAEKISMEQIL